jgi:hypothetical protein
VTDEAERLAAQARAEVRRNRILKYAWCIVLIPPFVVGFVLMDFETYVRATTLVTLLLSVFALSIGNHASQKAAEAKVASYEHP